MSAFLFYHNTELIWQCGTLLTLAKTKKKNLIYHCRLHISLLRYEVGIEKYMIVVVRQNKVGGGHNLIVSSTPFCKFQAIPFFSKKKKTTIQLLCVNANPVFALFNLCMTLNEV